MKLVRQAQIYWRNLQATAEHRREATITTWAEMKGRLQEKFVPACYRPMIIDEWQHLQQGDGSVADYITRFDDLMIRCNIDEEPVAILARFRAGLRLEYQRELVLHKVSTLEKAYRYANNMELYAAHTQRTNTTWFIVSKAARSQQQTIASKPANYLPNPLPRAGTPVAYSLLLPSPPLRLLLPVVPPVTPKTLAVVGYGNRSGSSTGPQKTRSLESNSLAIEWSLE